MISELRVGLSGTSLSNLAQHAESKGLFSYAHATFIEIKKVDKSIRVALEHAIYLWDFVNNFDHYFSAVSPIAFEDTLVVDYSTPRYHDVADFALMPVFFASFAEPIATTNQYVEWAGLQDGQVAIDLGAYSGLSAILFNQVVGDRGRVICVEPDATNLAATRKNVALYEQVSGHKIHVINSAAWEHCDGIDFSCEGNMGASAISIVGGRGKVMRVPTTTLTQIAEDLQLERVDFLKIDIEGAEEIVLRSSIDFLRRFRPRIVIEPHMVAGGMSTESCERQLEAAGYRFERIYQHGGTYMTGSSIPLIMAVPL